MFGLSIDGKVAWVTGGSRGIGRAVAMALATAGADVAVGYNSRADEAEAVCARVRDLGRRALAIQVDVSSMAACVGAQEQIAGKLGKIDILVNNAGIIRDNLFLMLEEDDWDKVLGTNLMGVVHASKTVIKDMMVKRWGRIINMSSVAATKGGRGQSNYAASKGAIEALTRSLAAEVGKRNITVNCVAPGVIETEMSAEVRQLAEKEILDRQLVQRFGSPDEVAAWVVLLASDQGGFVTGQTVHIDGGIKMA